MPGGARTTPLVTARCHTLGGGVQSRLPRRPAQSLLYWEKTDRANLVRCLRVPRSCWLSRCRSHVQQRVLRQPEGFLQRAAPHVSDDEPVVVPDFLPYITSPPNGKNFFPEALDNTIVYSYT